MSVGFAEFLRESREQEKTGPTPRSRQLDWQGRRSGRPGDNQDILRDYAEFQRWRVTAGLEFLSCCGCVTLTWEARPTRR